MDYYLNVPSPARFYPEYYWLLLSFPIEAFFTQKAIESGFFKSLVKYYLFLVTEIPKNNRLSNTDRKHLVQILPEIIYNVVLSSRIPTPNEAGTIESTFMDVETPNFLLPNDVLALFIDASQKKNSDNFFFASLFYEEELSKNVKDIFVHVCKNASLLPHIENMLTSGFIFISFFLHLLFSLIS